MADTTKKDGIWQTLIELPQKIIRYIYSGVVRIFAPRDDNYPETGVQPFEGDSPEDKNW